MGRNPEKNEADLPWHGVAADEAERRLRNEAARRLSSPPGDQAGEGADEGTPRPKGRRARSSKERSVETVSALKLPDVRILFEDAIGAQPPVTERRPAGMQPEITIADLSRHPEKIASLNPNEASDALALLLTQIKERGSKRNGRHLGEANPYDPNNPFINPDSLYRPGEPSTIDLLALHDAQLRAPGVDKSNPFDGELAREEARRRDPFGLERLRGDGRSPDIKLIEDAKALALEQASAELRRQNMQLDGIRRASVTDPGSYEQTSLLGRLRASADELTPAERAFLVEEDKTRFLLTLHNAIYHHHQAKVAEYTANGWDPDSRESDPQKFREEITAKLAKDPSKVSRYDKFKYLHLHDDIRRQHPEIFGAEVDVKTLKPEQLAVRTQVEQEEHTVRTQLVADLLSSADKLGQALRTEQARQGALSATGDFLASTVGTSGGHGGMLLDSDASTWAVLTDIDKASDQILGLFGAQPKGDNPNLQFARLYNQRRAAANDSLIDGYQHLTQLAEAREGRVEGVSDAIAGLGSAVACLSGNPEFAMPTASGLKVGSKWLETKTSSDPEANYSAWEMTKDALITGVSHLPLMPGNVLMSSVRKSMIAEAGKGGLTVLGREAIAEGEQTLVRQTFSGALRSQAKDTLAAGVKEFRSLTPRSALRLAGAGTKRAALYVGAGAGDGIVTEGIRAVMDGEDPGPAMVEGAFGGGSTGLVFGPAFDLVGRAAHHASHTRRQVARHNQKVDAAAHPAPHVVEPEGHPVGGSNEPIVVSHGNEPHSSEPPTLVSIDVEASPQGLPVRVDSPEDTPSAHARRGSSEVAPTEVGDAARNRRRMTPDMDESGAGVPRRATQTEDTAHLEELKAKGDVEGIKTLAMQSDHPDVAIESLQEIAFSNKLTEDQRVAMFQEIAKSDSHATAEAMLRLDACQATHPGCNAIKYQRMENGELLALVRGGKVTAGNIAELFEGCVTSEASARKFFDALDAYPKVKLTVSERLLGTGAYGDWIHDGIPEGMRLDALDYAVKNNPTVRENILHTLGIVHPDFLSNPQPHRMAALDDPKFAARARHALNDVWTTQPQRTGGNQTVSELFVDDRLSRFSDRVASIAPGETMEGQIIAEVRALEKELGVPPSDIEFFDAHDNPNPNNPGGYDLATGKADFDRASFKPGERPTSEFIQHLAHEIGHAEQGALVARNIIQTMEESGVPASDRFTKFSEAYKRIFGPDAEVSEPYFNRVSKHHAESGPLSPGQRTRAQSLEHSLQTWTEFQRTTGYDLIDRIYSLHDAGLAIREGAVTPADIFGESYNPAQTLVENTKRLTGTDRLPPRLEAGLAQCEGQGELSADASERLYNFIKSRHDLVQRQHRDAYTGAFHEQESYEITRRTAFFTNGDPR